MGVRRVPGTHFYLRVLAGEVLEPVGKRNVVSLSTESQEFVEIKIWEFRVLSPNVRKKICYTMTGYGHILQRDPRWQSGI